MERKINSYCNREDCLVGSTKCFSCQNFNEVNLSSPTIECSYLSKKELDEIICSFPQNPNKRIYLFGKTNRSSFRYWFAHWCAFQLTAINLGIWKFKYLLHDIEKPWLRLFLSYKTVQKIHRTYSKHHIEYSGGLDKVDVEAMMIDWECSRLTKASSQRDARQQMLTYQTKSPERYNWLVNNLKPILDKYEI